MRAWLRGAPLLALLSAGCSLTRMAVEGVTPALDHFVESLYAESDPLLARTAFETDLHLIDGLRRTQDNPRLAELQAMALTGYALVCWEGVDDARASRLYLRARDVGAGLLGADAFRMEEDAFQAWLAGVERGQLPGLFWTAFPYGAWMNLNLDSQEALFTLPRVEAMVKRSLELDEGYFFGAGHLFLGALDCTRPRFVGGNPEAGRERFATARRLGGPDLLLADWFEARHYCTATLDETRFDEILARARPLRDSLDHRPNALLNRWCLDQLDSLDAHRLDWF